MRRGKRPDALRSRFNVQLDMGEVDRRDRLRMITLYTLKGITDLHF